MRHLFVSETGEMLPRWQQAFPKAQASSPDGLEAFADQFDLVWLRLQSGLPITAQTLAVKQRLSKTAFVVLSDTPSDNEALTAFAAAARGYCNSHAAPAILRQVGMVVSQGGIWIGESLMHRLVARTDDLVVSFPSQKNPIVSLTSRELEVAQEIAAGGSNREIAIRLGITERTVKSHVSAILEKLQVRDRLQVALLLKSRLFP